MIKSTIKNILKNIKNSFSFLSFLFSILRHGELKDSIKHTYQGKLVILANGPSLSGVLPKLNSNRFLNVDFSVLNFFAESKEFWEIKPKHYCFVDPMFYGSSHREQQVRNVFSLLQKVDWTMNVYIIARNKEKFLTFSNLTNPNLKIISVNAEYYRGFPQFEFYFYAKGLACPKLFTVANMAIFVGINSGYSMIDLYGVDHTFFDSLCVDENNHLCNRDKHFYDNEGTLLKPILRNDNDQIWKISDYLFSIGQMFKTHDVLAEYAKYKKVNILNCTPGSMIDSYPRNSQTID